jgi:hypothetical protein
MLKLTMCMIGLSGFKDRVEVIDRLDFAAVGRIGNRLPDDVIVGVAAQLDRGVEDDRETEDEDQTVEEAGALKHCRFPFAERDCSTNGGRLTSERIGGSGAMPNSVPNAARPSQWVGASPQTGPASLQQQKIDIAFAILTRDRHDHSSLSVLAQRLPAPPSVVSDRVIAALLSRHPVVTRRAETASAGSVSAASRTGSAVRPRRPILALSALQSIAFRPTGPEQPSPKSCRLLINPGITRRFWRFSSCS